MFDNGFFPTPPHAIDKMIEGLKFSQKSVLDPSAGKGNILEYILERMPHYNRAPSRLYAIESNPDLRAILVEKMFSVVGTDFLTFPGLQYFDFILMNPPFDNGATHLLQAWKIAHGATIRCLLNSETLRNPYTNERKMLCEIIEQYGWIKELGSIFKNAERKTDVEVSLIHLQDTRPQETFRLHFDPETIATGDFSVDDMQENALALANIFNSYEARFIATIEAFKELLAARAKVKHFLGPLMNHNTPDDLVGKALANDREPTDAYHAFLETSTKAAWDMLFSKTKLGAVTTENVRREIESMQNRQGMMAFTALNMEDLFNILFLNRENVMLQCVLEVFDYLTDYYKENRVYYEGWKSNSAYMVGKKFILPNIGSYYSDAIDYAAARKLADIEKALCFISGQSFVNIRSIDRVYGRDPHFGERMTSQFFDTKLFKKRTMHFWWLDEDLRVEFNTMVARERWGELPDKVKKGVYK
jgi:hypothetical protein